MNNNSAVPDDIKQEFQDLATRVCLDAQLDDEEWPSERDRLVRRWEHYYRQGADEGLSPLEAKARAMKAWGDLSRLTKSLRDPWYIRLLSYERCRSMRYFLIVLGILSVFILVLPTMLAFMLTGLVAYLTADVFRTDRQIDWIRWLVNLGCHVVFVILSLVGGLCLIIEKRGFWGPWEKALALWHQVRHLLSVRRFGPVPVQILFVLLLFGLIGQHGGFRPASDADRFIAAKSSSRASHSITERRAGEVVRGLSSVAKAATPATERKPSDNVDVPGGNPARSGTMLVEADTPSSVDEPSGYEVFDRIVSFGKEAGSGIEPAASEIAGGITDGSSKLPANDGPTISTAEPKVKQVVTEVASLAKEERGAIEPTAITAESSALSTGADVTMSIVEPKLNETSGGVVSSASEKSRAIELAGSEVAGGVADSPASAGLVDSRLHPAVPKADQRTPAPAGLRIVFLGP